MLLQDSRVDPSADNNRAIRYASRKGHIEVVKLLLQDNRVNPLTKTNSAIGYACKYGKVEVVELLLQDNRVKEKYKTSKMLDPIRLKEKTLKNRRMIEKNPEFAMFWHNKYNLFILFYILFYYNYSIYLI